MLTARSLLPTEDEVRVALGPDVRLEPASSTAPAGGAGGVIKAAAADSAFRRFAGSLLQAPEPSPMAVSALALVFESAPMAMHTFTQVAEAAHLRVQLDGSSVAVETVTAPSGLVSYWGFVHRDRAIVVLTLDTVDPQRLSVGSLRSLASIAAKRLEAATASRD
ncbi:MAG: hypothetical protein JOZ41_03665 [Chloroflexi bacterium]|nr:hypothetical protein [Chloroflexota bacterium]